MRIDSARSVTARAIARCLSAAERRDPLSIPADFSEADRPDALVAVRDDEVVGVAWSRPCEHGEQVEVRVDPAHRRRGIGSALFERLDRPDRALMASCDAGQIRVRRFLEGRGFDLSGVTFVQRWDGDLADVPRAFRSAAVEPAPERTEAIEVLDASVRTGGPTPLFDRPALLDPATRVRVARIDGRPVGLCAARRVDDGFSVGAFGVLAEVRGQGVGRALICELMRTAAADDAGVMLRVSPADEYALEWTRRLGFWTCRSWLNYLRRPLDGGGIRRSGAL